MGKHHKRKRRIAYFITALILLAGTSVFTLYRHYEPELTRHSTAAAGIAAMVKAATASYAKLQTTDDRVVYIVRKGEKGHDNMLAYIEEEYGWTYVERMGAILYFADGSEYHEVYNYPFVSLFTAWEIAEE